MSHKFPPCPPPVPDGEALTAEHEQYILAAYGLEKGATWITKRMGLRYSNQVYAVLKKHGVAPRSAKKASQALHATRFHLSTLR